MRPGLAPLAALLALTACGAPPTPAATDADPGTVPAWPAPPEVPDGDVPPEVAAAVGDLIAATTRSTFDRDALATVAAADDARLGWVLADLLRFTPAESSSREIGDAFATLTGADADDERFGSIPWLRVTNLMIGWDLPAPPGYVGWKRDLFVAWEPGWQPFFEDADAAVDWRWITWGGVFMDDRPIGDASLCDRGCIPALDDPALTDAAGGDWYGDDRPVFGIVVDGEAVAFPKHVMEVHEMVNLTVGGRRIGMPYCTLCGSAQAYLTDAVPEGIETPILRTTGLLSRSNKVMADLTTHSLFNTFTGRAISGPLHERGIVLEPVTVVTTTWGAWKDAHPDTRIVARDGGIGRSYPEDPLQGRDDDGPIFPTGPIDVRLPAHAQVLGVLGTNGPVAFPADAARAALDAGDEVELDGVALELDGGGLRARIGPDEVPAHQAFWFAWSQFHPDTGLWSPPAGG